MYRECKYISWMVGKNVSSDGGGGRSKVCLIITIIQSENKGNLVHHSSFFKQQKHVNLY